MFWAVTALQSSSTCDPSALPRLPPAISVRRPISDLLARLAWIASDSLSLAPCSRTRTRPGRSRGCAWNGISRNLPVNKLDLLSRGIGLRLGARGLSSFEIRVGHFLHFSQDTQLLRDIDGGTIDIQLTGDLQLRFRPGDIPSGCLSRGRECGGGRQIKEPFNGCSNALLY